jgi:hypothetical protein
MSTAALLQTSVPVQSLPMFVNSRTVIASPTWIEPCAVPRGMALERAARPRSSVRTCHGHLLSIRNTDWVPTTHR